MLLLPEQIKREYVLVEQTPALLVDKGSKFKFRCQRCSDEVSNGDGCHEWQQSEGTSQINFCVAVAHQW
jgi:hypothetical protein